MDMERGKNMNDRPESGIDRKALWKITYGLYVVASHLGDKLNGQMANTVFQIALKPMSIAVSINKKNLTHKYISASKVFSVSVLDEETPMDLIRHFGFKSGRDINKFADVHYENGVTDSPLVVNEYALSVMEAKVIDEVEVGDEYTVFIGEIVNSRVLKEGEPLTYAYYQRVKKGRAPKTAPTYKGRIEKKSKITIERGKGKMKKYVCSVCGYVYDPAKGDPDGGIKPGTPFKDIPDDWVCPVCGVTKDQFELEEE